MALSLLSTAALAAEGTTEVKFTPKDGTEVTYKKAEDANGNITLYFDSEKGATNYATASYELNGKIVTFKGATLRSVNNLMRAYWEVCKNTTGCDYNPDMLPANESGTLTWTIYGKVEQGEYLNSGALILPALSGGYIYNNSGYQWKKIAVNAGTKNATIVSNSNFSDDYGYISAGKESTTITGIKIDGSTYAKPANGSNLIFESCTIAGMIRTPNGNGKLKVTGCTFVGDTDTENSNKKNEYVIFSQAGGELEFTSNIVSSDVYTRGLNVGGNTNLNAKINGNNIGAVSAGYSAIQLSGKVTSATISSNNIALDGTNAFTLHNSLSAKPTVSITDNNITGTGYLIYDDAAANNKSFTSDKLTLTMGTGESANTIANTVDTTKGVKDGNTTALTGYVAAVTQGKDITGKVAQVGTEYYTTLADALAALTPNNHTLTLIDGRAWDAEKPVYWQAGTESGYVAKLTDALTAAYKAGPSDDITIVCRPGADVGTMTHGHVADNLTIYGNNAYISGGECDLEVDTYMYSRKTGKQVTENGVYLDKDITITAYELDNLGVWGQRTTNHTVTVNLTDCDGNSNVTPNVQRVYISGATGVNNITLKDCDFITNNTSVYSNADGAVVIDNCSFTGSQVPVNFNHEATGTQTVTVSNSTFTECGNNGGWAQFAAPIRFVNSGSGTSTTTVDNCTFNKTVGSNGDILIGDGRTGKESNDVTLKVKNTAANVQAQKPGYYNGGTADVTKMMAKQVAENERLETSVNKLLPNAAKIGNTEYATLKEALESLSNTTEENVTIELLADQNVAGFTVDLSNSAIKTLTIQGNGKKLDSLVNGVDIDAENGKPRCPVINAKLRANATFSVDGIVAPNSLLFDTGNEASLVVMNSTFNESQTGYPAAKNITYQGNTFEFKGNADNYFTHNAYPIWYKTNDSTRSIAFLNNKVTGPRGFHIETRSKEADKQVNIKANGNTFNLSDSSTYENKTIALQLVRYLNGEIEFKDNQVNAYMGVCFFKGIAAQNNPKLTIKNNYTSGKLYGSSEWNTDGSTTEEKIAAADNFARGIVEGRKSADNGSAITEGHTHNYVNGKCTICGQTAPSYSGGSSSDPTYSVSTPSKTEHGTVTVSPKSASKGDRVTVTVKPDSGYVLETLTVTDKNGNELTLKHKGDGKYTFTMPAGKVEVKATFMEDNSMLNFFYDVPNDAYFYEAVKWAVENGITTGVGNDLFAPEQPCTRAQIVTFLWRAAGSPEPKGAASGMTDVVSGSYYEKAVAWAIENGITTGTTTSTFSPDATCTRAQAVTFLARALKAKAASAAEFSDVPTNSYFADAVAWAAANGVTEGIGGGLFGSDNDCTRGQIVTFLYRAYNK